MFYILKTLLEFTKPCLIIFLSLCFVLGLLNRNKTKPAKKFLAILLLVLAVVYPPVTAKFLLASLENQYPTIPVEESPKADAIVVLGGTLSGLTPPRRELEEISGARLTTAARIFHHDKAPLILVSGGVKYQSTSGMMRYESMDMKTYLTDLLVPEASILEESQSRNTEENYKFSLPILKAHKIRKIILVTSAFHMPRAMNWFKRSELEIIPFPTEYRSTPSLGWNDYIPDGDSLSLFTAMIKEYLGLLAFKTFQS